MKCVCGYEHNVESLGDGLTLYVGEKPFETVDLYIYNAPVNAAPMINGNQVKLLSCPECGTVKVVKETDNP